jgi:hypothetical protein
VKLVEKTVLGFGNCRLAVGHAIEAVMLTFCMTVM